MRNSSDESGDGDGGSRRACASFTAHLPTLCPDQTVIVLVFEVVGACIDATREHEVRVRFALALFGPLVVMVMVMVMVMVQWVGGAVAVGVVVHLVVATVAVVATVVAA